MPSQSLATAMGNPLCSEQPWCIKSTFLEVNGEAGCSSSGSSQVAPDAASAGFDKVDGPCLHGGSAGSTWSWHVKNTFVEVRDDDDSSVRVVPNGYSTRSDPGPHSEASGESASGSELAVGPPAAGAGGSFQASPPHAPPGMEPPPEAAAASQRSRDRCLSIGSLGHPVLCTLRCKHLVTKGHCPQGQQCLFCHAPQCRLRARQLDKKNRESFLRLTIHRKIDVMLPILKEKVDALHLGERSQQALEEWHNEVAREAPCREPSPGKHVAETRERRLFSVLRCMSITDLCGLPGPQEAFLKEATTRLLRDLRHIARTSQQA